ncbi:ATP-dependent sacrificial sulfur transferase LarE [Bacteroidota bacterium]
MNKSYPKLDHLKSIMSKMDAVIVAFSGGVDSTFLLKTAKDALGNNVLAVTAESSAQPTNELRETKKIAAELEVEHIFVQTNELEDKEFTANPTNRCYLCKSKIYSEVKKVADEKKIEFIIEGSNADDVNDYRPGLTALEELGILSPLKQAGLTKSEIRKLSKSMGLPTWDKPALACLASRIPYGSEITHEKLRRIDKAESFLRENGFKQVRVRDHQEIARIEIEKENLDKILENNFYSIVVKKFKDLGYSYVTIDLEGYRTGSMNINLD